MINYYIEFAIIHLVLYVGYKLLLQTETNLGLRRSFLIGSILLALVLPLIHIPVSSAIHPMDISEAVSTIVLPEFTIQASAQPQPWFTQLPWYSYLYLLASTLIIIRLLVALSRIMFFYFKSVAVEVDGITIRHMSGLNSVFTFVNWIFLDKDMLDQSNAIIKHEQAHIKYGHSYDLLLLNLVTVTFWWVPSIWAILKEIKDIHEFQADSSAASSSTQEEYSRTIITYTLKNQGIILANSFNDTEITKRLKFMKQLKRKVSNWKITSLILMLTLTVYTFSCQEAVNEELADEANAITGEVFLEVDEPATYKGGIEEFYSYVGTTLSYPEEAKKKGVTGKVFVEMVISDKGKVSNVRVLKGAGYGLDEEAKRIVANSPDWIPANHNGEAVNTKLVLPISFKLSKDQEGAGGFSQQKEMPTFPGGKMALFEYLQANIKYPDEAEKAGIEGKVLVEFLVDSDGAVKNANVKVGFNPACDAEALRIVESLPNWEPIKKAGKPVPSTMVLPIVFRLN